MAQQRVYICPDHPDKTYTSWRKFRGHWSTLHRGEECPPREDFLQMMEKEERIESKKEIKETKKVEREEREFAEGEFILPEDPVPRLAKILEVHGVDQPTAEQVLGVFQLHPGYRDNPVNLHYLLTAKLPRRIHSSIPMMISAFSTQESSYPEGGMPGMMPGMGGPGMMPPYMMGGPGMASPYYYPPSYGLQPPYRPPMGGREPPEEGEARSRAKESNPIEDIVSLLGTIITLKDQLIPSSEGSSKQVQEIFEGFRATVEEQTKLAAEQQEKLLTRMEASEEGRKKDIEDIKVQLHQAETGRLQDKIDSLESTKDEEKSAGLGQLLKEAGEGVSVQADGVRQSVSQMGDKISSLAEKIVSVEGAPKGPSIEKEPTAVNVKTIEDATELVKTEEELEVLAKALS